MSATASAFDITDVDEAKVLGKVKCQVCGHEDHSLHGHIKSAHGLTAEQYYQQYPGADLMSVLGKEVYDKFLRRPDIASKAKEKGFSSIATFNVGFGKDGKVDKIVKGYEGYTKEDGVPDVDPHYYFQPDITRDFLMGTAVGTRIYLMGPTGSGKTTLPQQICARTGRPFCRVQFHGEMEPIELTGTWTVGKGGEMVYLYSDLARALQKPSTIVLDEFDSGNPTVTAIANALLERNPLVLSNKGGEKIYPHPDCIIVATGNTNGMGDETGLYTSTTPQSFATMNRFGMVIIIDYMPEDQEHALIKRIYPQMPEQEVRDMTKLANLIREGFKGGKCNAVISTRQLVAWGQWLAMTGKPKRSFELAFTNQLGTQDLKVVTELYQRVYGSR